VLGACEPGADGDPDDGADVGAEGATLGDGLAGVGEPHADTKTRLSRMVVGRRNVGVSMARETLPPRRCGAATIDCRSVDSRRASEGLEQDGDEPALVGVERDIDVRL
jgi:hypothetical protein